MGVKYIVIFVSAMAVAQTMAQPHTSNLSTTEDMEAIDGLLKGFTVTNSNSSSTNNSHLTEEFTSCLKREISPNEYTILENGTLYVYNNKSSKVLFDYGSYYISENNVAYICFLPAFITSPEGAANHILSYITIIGISISLLSLLLHFIAFLVVPEMKNLPGMNLASLTVAIFFGYFLFLVGHVAFENTPVCYPLGLWIYYFMMASFFWMNAISFDVLRSVRTATKKLRIISKCGERKWFLIYSLYSWITPAAFSGMVITADILTFLPEEFRPKFDKQLCWFGQRLALITFFASPLGILMLINIVFFISSTAIIYSNSMKSDYQTKTLKRSLKLYLKLAVIMGLAWITGLIAGAVDNKYFSYIFVILTVLQGLFIFVAFTRFRKLMKEGAVLREGINTIVTTIHGSSFFGFSIRMEKA